MTKTLYGAALCAALLVPGAACAADKSFEGPAGWNHVVTGTPGAARSQDVWKAGDGGPNADVLTVLTDASLPLADAVNAVRTNIRTNGMRFTIDEDRMCDGRKAHTFEMAFGAEKKTVVNQTILEQGSGSTRITYSRVDPQPFSPDVKAALAQYCGA